MTVWRSGDRATYRYRFYHLGQRYQGNTGQRTEVDAKEWEATEQRRISRLAGGLDVLPEHAPSFTDWSTIYLRHLKQKGRVRRIDRVEELLRVVLRFWGEKPPPNAENPPVEGEPYHDLTLADPIRDPSWILKFEAWMDARRTRVGNRPIGNQTKKHYLSVLSRMYRVAKLPQYVKQTGVQTNPFADLERPRTKGRTVTVTPAELRRWLREAPLHAQLAMSIASLAPKLRLANVLALRWDRDLDAGLRFITVADHKEQDRHGAPLVIPIVPALRTILKAARDEQRGPWVVTYRGEPVTSIRASVREAAKSAGLTYGRDVEDGVTFHTIRHSCATLLAEVPSLNEKLRAETMGQDIETTQRYTHLRPAHQRPVLRKLAARLKLDTIMREAFGRRPEVLSEVPHSRPTQKHSGKHAIRKTPRRRVN